MPIQAFRPDSKQILNPFDIVRRAQLKIDSLRFPNSLALAVLISQQNKIKKVKIAQFFSIISVPTVRNYIVGCSSYPFVLLLRCFHYPITISLVKLPIEKVNMVFEND